VRQLAGLGLASIDVRPFAFEQSETAAALADTGVNVCCLAASFGLIDAASLDHGDPASRAGAIAYTERAIEHAADLGAEAVYLVPGTDDSPGALGRYAAVMAPLAQSAQDRGMTLSLEHFPGLALPTVAATRAFVESVDHPNLHVLVDIGHAQMEGITPATAIEIAGDRLGYVHLDDNDGVGDLHQALLDGMLTEAALKDTFMAISSVGYSGAVSLELSPALDAPETGLRRSLDIVRRLSA
jgi:sugar phosphate isomerase/epimerase